MSHSKIADFEKNPIYRIYAVNHIIHGVYSNYFSMTRLKVNTEQFLLLTALKYGGPHNQQMLADFIHKDKATMTRMITKMTASGLLKRVTDNADKRNNYIEITEKGEKTRAALQKTFKELNDYALRDIPEKELEKMVDCLFKIQQNLM